MLKSPQYARLLRCSLVASDSRLRSPNPSYAGLRWFCWTSQRLRDQGLAVVVISHNLADVFEVVDRVIVLRLGRRVGTFDIKTTTPEQVVASITGAEFGELMATDSATNDNDS